MTENTNLDLGLDYLSIRTPSGLFCDGYGVHYWVLNCQLGRVSVLLDQWKIYTLPPCFSFEILSDTPVKDGTWIGPIELSLGTSKKPKRLFNGLSGVIYRDRDGLALNACGPNGSSYPLILGDWGAEHVRKGYAIDDWTLLVHGSNETLTYTPSPAPLGPYKQRDWVQAAFDEPRRIDRRN